MNKKCNYLPSHRNSCNKKSGILHILIIQYRNIQEDKHMMINQTTYIVCRMLDSLKKEDHNMFYKFHHIIGILMKIRHQKHQVQYRCIQRNYLIKQMSYSMDILNMHPFQYCLHMKDMNYDTFNILYYLYYHHNMIIYTSILLKLLILYST